MQERRNSSVLAVKLCLSCPSTYEIYWMTFVYHSPILTFAVQNLFWETQSYTFIFQHFLIMGWHRKFKSFLMEEKDLFILHSQCYGRWWSGYTKSQDISCHGIDLSLLEWYGFQHQKDVVGAICCFMCKLIWWMLYYKTCKLKLAWFYFLTVWKSILSDSNWTPIEH